MPALAEILIWFIQIANYSNCIAYQELYLMLVFYSLAGCVLVHGQTMVRELEVFTHATVMKQQSKREWYAMRGFMLASSVTCNFVKHEIWLLSFDWTAKMGPVRRIGEEERDGQELLGKIHSLLWAMGIQPIGMHEYVTIPNDLTMWYFSINIIVSSHASR